MNAETIVTFDAVSAIVAQLPRDGFNPDDMHGCCLYTSVDDPDHHCIVGEIWTRLGLSVPGPDCFECVPLAAQNCGTFDIHAPGVIAALDELQAWADTESSAGRDWSWAIDHWPAVVAAFSAQPSGDIAGQGEDA